MQVKNSNLLLGVLCLVSVTLSSAVFAQQQTQQNSETTTSQQNSGHMASTVRGVLLFSDSIIGAAVKNEQGEEIGDIQRLLVNPQTGLVSYVEVSVGGFLGMGDRNVVVPWRALTASREGDALVLNVSKQILQQAPEPETMQTTQTPPPEPQQEQPQDQKQEQQREQQKQN